MRLIDQILHNRRAVTSIEYGLICALIVIAIIISVSMLGGQVTNSYTNLGNAFPRLA